MREAYLHISPVYPAPVYTVSFILQPTLLTSLPCFSRLLIHFLPKYRSASRTTYRSVTDDLSEVRIAVGVRGGGASTTSLLRDASVLHTKKLYACRTLPVLPPGFKLHAAPVYSNLESQRTDEEDSKDSNAMIELSELLNRLDASDKIPLAREWCSKTGVDIFTDVVDQLWDLFAALQIQDPEQSMQFFKEAGALHMHLKGYPSSFWCPLQHCPMRSCCGTKLIHLRPRPCYLLGPEFVKQVACISAYCPRCQMEIGPWDTEANCGVEVHSKVAFTLAWCAEAEARIEGNAAPGVVAAELFYKALRSISAQAGGSAQQILDVLNPRKQRTIIDAAATGLSTHIVLLHSAANSCLGKMGCPVDGVFAPVVVIDGTRHQLTKLTATMIRAMARNAQPGCCMQQAAKTGMDDSPLLESEQRSWHSLVEEVLDDLCIVPQTAKGSASFSRPAKGGILAHEHHLLYFALDEVCIGTYGIERIPTTCRYQYNPQDVPMFIVAGARADEQRVGHHLRKSKIYRSDSRTKNPHATDSLGSDFVSFFSEHSDFQQACVASELKKQDLPTLSGWWTAFRSLVHGNDRSEHSNTCCNEQDKTKKLPLTLDRGQLISFFSAMLDISISSMMGHQPKAESRGFDGGPLGKLCACGERYTMARTQIQDSETVSHCVDIIYGGTNHGPNAVMYDNACRNGLAGHMAMRLPVMVPAMGGFGRLGAAVSRERVDDWFGPRKQPGRYEWLDGSTWGPSGDLVNVDLLFRGYHLGGPHPLTKHEEFFAVIDALHSSKTQHPTLECGCHYKSMFLGLEKYDSQSAEQLWSQQAPLNGYMSTLSPGKKLLMQCITDHGRSSGNFSAAVASLYSQALVDSAVRGCQPAYDSTQRIVWRCTICGLPPDSCDHHNRCEAGGSFQHLSTATITLSPFHRALRLRQHPTGLSSSAACPHSNFQGWSQSLLAKMRKLLADQQLSIELLSLQRLKTASEGPSSASILAELAVASFDPANGFFINSKGNFVLRSAGVHAGCSPAAFSPEDASNQSANVAVEIPEMTGVEEDVNCTPCDLEEEEEELACRRPSPVVMGVNESTLNSEEENQRCSPVDMQMDPTALSSSGAESRDQSLELFPITDQWQGGVLPADDWSAHWCSCALLPTTLTEGQMWCWNAVHRVCNKLLDASRGLLVRYRSLQQSQDEAEYVDVEYFVVCMAVEWGQPDTVCLLGVPFDRPLSVDRPKKLLWKLVVAVRSTTSAEHLDLARAVYLSTSWGQCLLHPPQSDGGDEYMEDADLWTASIKYFADFMCERDRCQSTAQHFIQGAALRHLIDQEAEEDRWPRRRVVDTNRVPKLKEYLTRCLKAYATHAAAIVHSMCCAKGHDESLQPLSNDNRQLLQHIMHLIPHSMRESLTLVDSEAIQLLDYDDEYKQRVLVKELRLQATYWGLTLDGGTESLLARLREQAPGRRAWQQGLGLDSFKGSVGDGPGSKTAKMKEQLDEDAERLIPLPKAQGLCLSDFGHVATCRRCGVDRSAAGPVNSDDWWECSQAQDQRFASCDKVDEALHLAATHESHPAMLYWSSLFKGSEAVGSAILVAYNSFIAGATQVPTKRDFARWLVAHELSDYKELLRKKDLL